MSPRPCAASARRALGGCMFLAWLLGACGDNTPTAEKETSAGPLYAIATQILGPAASFTTYIALVQSLDRPESIDLGSALEEPGRSIAVGRPGAGEFFVLGAESPLITRYELLGNTLVAGPSLSLAAYGVSFAPASSQQFIFLSGRKALFLDASTLQLFVWDPAQMVVLNVVPLAELERPGWTPVFLQTPLVRGEQVVFVTSYFRAEEDRYDRETRLCLFDPTLDRIVRVLSDQRCAFLGHALTSPSGDVYFASDVLTAIAGRLLGPEHGGPSCVLRLAANSSDWDPSVLIPLDTAGATAGSLIPAGGTRAFTRLLDERLLPEPTPMTVGELRTGPFWRWAALDLTAPDAPAPLDLAPAVASVLRYDVDGRSYAGQLAPDFASTTLLDMSAEPEPRLGLTISGTVASILRLR